MRELYRVKGYSDEWIEKRMRGIAVRDKLTNEWKNRGVEEGKEFAILTSEISKATFGLTPSEYKEHKKLKNENLRDHMNDLELIFTMLGEASTTKIAQIKDAKGFEPNKQAAVKGGSIAGGARKELEKEIGESVVTPENFLEEPEKLKRKRLTESKTPSQKPNLFNRVEDNSMSYAGPLPNLRKTSLKDLQALLSGARV